LKIYQRVSLFIFLLFLSPFALAQLPGNYRVNFNAMCSDGVSLMLTYDLDLQENNTYTLSGSGSYTPGYTTLNYECAGTWSKIQRQITIDQPTCNATDLANYSSGENVGPLPRTILNDYLNNSIEGFMDFPPRSNKSFILHNDPTEVEELIIDGVITERVCNRQGTGVRLKNNNATILPVLEGPINP
jgi:hypothetical protein